MIRALALRATELLFVLFGVSVLTFLMIRLVPGDAVEIMLGANSEVTPDRIAALRETLGLDRPLLEQYLRWLAKALQGDFGASLWTGRPVAEEIASRAGVTLELTLLALALAAILSVPAGCLMAYARSSAADYIIRILTITGVTVPSFWLGVLLIYGFYVYAPGVQVVGYIPFSQAPLANLERMALPTVTLALPVIASLARIVRSAMLDALSQDYIRTARAKGLAERSVVFKHALGNALIPFVTALGIMAGYLLSGSIVVEQVFALPGLGRLIVGAVAERNYPLIQAAILLVTVSFVAVNLLVDLLYVVIDPRARTS